MTAEEDARELGRQTADALIRAGRSITEFRAGMVEAAMKAERGETPEEDVSEPDPWASSVQGGGTTYDRTIRAAYKSIERAIGVTKANDAKLEEDPSAQKSDMDLVHLTRADVESRLAIAEQARIQNLMTYAMVATMDDDSGEEQERILAQVKEALGL